MDLPGPTPVGRPATRRRTAVGVVVLVALLVAVTAAAVWGRVDLLRLPGVPGALVAGVLAGDGTCTVAPGTPERDVDTDDTPEYPWARVPGQPAVVHFETGALPARYARMVERGAQLWSQGPCVRAVAVLRCPPASNCSTVRTAEGAGDDGETDGDSEGTQVGGIRVANAINLYPELLDESSDNGALVTVVHEMGHALGLRHRADPDAMMNASTDDDTTPEPDEIDFGNLLAIYGTALG